MATNDPPAHRSSTEERESTEGPEPRLERRWRPAAIGGVRPSDDAQRDASPQGKSGDGMDAPSLDLPAEPSPSEEHPDAQIDERASDGPADPKDPGSDGTPTDQMTPAQASQTPPSTAPSDSSGASGPTSEHPPSSTDEGTQEIGKDFSGEEGESARPEAEEEREESSGAGSEEAREEGRRINDEAFADASDESWTDTWRSDAPSPPSESDASAGGEEFFTDDTRRSGPAERVEEAVQDFAYHMNEGTAPTDWTPEQRRARRTATTFALLVSKVAEDMSYQRRPGDEFWDPRKIMRRQIDNRPLRHCKMEYTKRRLALLVDTSPSCRDEAVFYSKIASGAMLRDDIDIFLCPNGHIDARFDPEPMRFVTDDRGDDWDLEGRTVLYFTDWDGSDQIVHHSRDCNLYWFDNCPPEQYWERQTERHQRIRLRYKGHHFHCPDPEAFRSLVRKIRP